MYKKLPLYQLIFLKKKKKKGNEMIKVILSTLSKNQIFGEMSLLNFSGSTSAAAIAISPVEVYVMEFQFIEKLFKTSNRLMKRFYYEVMNVSFIFFLIY